MLLIVTPQKLHQVLLNTYVFPSIFGWNVTYLFKSVSIISHNVVQNALKMLCPYLKWCSLVYQSAPIPYPKNKFVASFPLMAFLKGIITRPLNLPTITNMKSCPFLVVGKPPTKCMEMFSQGCVGIGKGWYRPCFLLLGFLIQQSMHPLMNLTMCYCILC